MTNKYKGDEQNNPILKHIRQVPNYVNFGQSLEIPNLQDAYKLWNAAKLGVVPFLTSPEEYDWFGHSLFTANVKIYMGYQALEQILYLFSSNPIHPIIPSPPTGASYDYGPSRVPYSGAELQIERYSAINTFFGHLLGALDVMTVSLAYLYGFERIRKNLKPYFVNQNSFKKPIKPLKIYFSTGVALLREVKTAQASNSNKPTNLIHIFKNEGLLDIDASSKTLCDWYENLKSQRHYHTHVGFPMLYIDDGEWRIPFDSRSTTPVDNLTPSIPDFCSDIFKNTHRFIGAVYGCAWTDFCSHLPP